MDGGFLRLSIIFVLAVYLFNQLGLRDFGLVYANVLRKPIPEDGVSLDIRRGVPLEEGSQFWVGCGVASERCDRGVHLVVLGDETESESVRGPLI